MFNAAQERNDSYSTINKIKCLKSPVLVQSNLKKIYQNKKTPTHCLPSHFGIKDYTLICMKMKAMSILLQRPEFFTYKNRPKKLRIF